MCKIQSELFAPSQAQFPSCDLNLSFSEYITQCKQLISHSRLDLNTPQAQHIITANMPFELRPERPTRRGALLIHGLLDSPLNMRDIGLQLQAQGVLTRAILLPGHGTRPGDLLHVDYHQWLEAVRYGITTFANEVDTLFLIGYSTGASLALYHALQNTNHIAGIVLLAPALKVASPFASIANAYKALSWAWPRAAWLYQDTENDYAKYTSIPFNAVYQVYRLAQAIKKAPPSSQPLFFALAQNDNTVSSSASLKYFKQQTNPNNQLVLYTNSPIADDPRITQRHTSYPLLRIRDFSHLSLPISPDNSHYGEKGDYPLASHVQTDDYTVYGEFNPSQIRLNEWLVKLKLSQHHYQRLTFNPDFDFLMRKMMEFLDVNHQ